MEISLKHIIISTQPKVGFYVFINNNFNYITEINGTSVTIDDGSTVDKDAASNNILKFIAVYKNKEYSIVHGDYSLLVEALNSPAKYTTDAPDERKTYETLKDAFLNGESCVFEATLDEINKVVNVGETIEITDIDVIDRHNLLDKSKRFFEIKSKANKKYTYIVNINGTNVMLRRRQFRKIGDTDIMVVAHIKCPYCNR